MKSALLVSMAFVFSTAAVVSAQVVVSIPGCLSDASVDDDSDRLGNVCEFELASRFAPVLRVRSEGCNWDSRQSRLGGGYFYAVQPTDSVVRIAYMPAYFRDCGWKGPKCWIPGVDCSPHAGDSEFVVIELSEPRTGAFVVSAIFLSAHCFGRSGKHCRWYHGDELQQFKWRDASPVIWVSDGRNANYRSRRECDKGHHSLDTCDKHDAEYVFPVQAERNVGSKTSSTSMKSRGFEPAITGECK